MKNSDSISVGPSVPSLFQIAAFFEDFFPTRGWARSIITPNQHPVTEYMLNPEKLMSLLISCKTEGKKEGKNASGTTAVSDREQQAKKTRGSQPKRSASPSPTPSPAPEPAPQKSREPEPARAADGAGVDPTRKIEFTLKSPAASSVKLAGDFTEWEAHAVEMMHSNEGVWHTVVPLPPGSYSYRFIVDGEWCDDPARDHVPNPFGGQNAVIHVT